MLESNSEIILYQAEDGTTKIDVRLEKETVCLTLNQLAELFQRDKSVISRHIQNIFAEGELSDSATIANYATVQTENNWKSQPRNYWKVLKHRMLKDGNQSVTNCNQLKLQSSDGKFHLTDVADAEQILCADLLSS